MTLYHGSNVTVLNPAILPTIRTLDFGEGFYTTTNKEQAEIFAHKVFNRRKTGEATVNVYELDYERVVNESRILRFNTPDENWLDYVVANRLGIFGGQSFDIVFGPVADDDVYLAIGAYEAGLLTKEQTIASLKIKNLYDQLVFKSASSLLFLIYIKSYVL